jgi:N-acetylglucosaminyldiphosphoundecaprenol N-acetyl-beta-D-mannosaminyltransferase
MSSFISRDDATSAPSDAPGRARPSSPGSDAAPAGADAVPIAHQDRLARTVVFGLPLVDAPSLEPVLDQILVGAPPEAGLLPLVLTPNVDIVVHLDRNRDGVEADLFRRAQYCLPDGAPIVVASRLVRRPLRARLAGSDLFAMLWPRLVTAQVPVVVVASSEAVAQALADDDPRAEFVVPPIVDADDREAMVAVADEIIEAARRVRPRMVLFGIGNPKDARLIGAMLDRWDPSIGEVPLAMGLGASFALHLGLQKRAPRWVQRLGMEWFHRFLQEPRRLYRRYFIDDLAFVPIVWRELRGRSRVRRDTES